MSREQEFLTCLRALVKVIQHQWYSDKTKQLKTPQGIFEWFVTCLLDQGVNPEHHFRVVNGLRRSGWLDYTKLQSLLVSDPDKLKHDLREALKSYRFPNKATKAILTNVEKIGREYKGDLHNILHFSEDMAEVWKRVNELYWFGAKKSAVFIKDLVNEGVWQLSVEEIPIPPDSRVRRVLFKIGLVKDRNDLKEVMQVARELSKEAGITSLDLDCVLWTIGDERICGERKSFCERCPLDFYCPNYVPQEERQIK